MEIKNYHIRHSYISNISSLESQGTGLSIKEGIISTCYGPHVKILVDKYNSENPEVWEHFMKISFQSFKAVKVIGIYHEIVEGRYLIDIVLDNLSVIRENSFTQILIDSRYIPSFEENLKKSITCIYQVQARYQDRDEKEQLVEIVNSVAGITDPTDPWPPLVKDPFNIL